MARKSKLQVAEEQRLDREARINFANASRISTLLDLVYNVMLHGDNCSITVDAKPNADFVFEIFKVNERNGAPYTDDSFTLNKNSTIEDGDLDSLLYYESAVNNINYAVSQQIAKRYAEAAKQELIDLAVSKLTAEELEALLNQ